MLLKWFSCKNSQEENLHMFLDFKMTCCHRLFLHGIGEKISENKLYSSFLHNFLRSLSCFGESMVTGYSIWFQFGCAGYRICVPIGCWLFQRLHLGSPFSLKMPPLVHCYSSNLIFYLGKSHYCSELFFDI